MPEPSSGEAAPRGWKSTLAGHLLVPGAGVLFSRRTRRLLVLSVLGAVVTALLDMAGIAALVPLMQVISGAEGGAVLDAVRDLLGNDLTDREVAIRLAILIVVLFGLKSTLTIAFRWWQIGFVAREQVATSTLLLRSYLLAPYRQFVQRSIPDYVRNLGNAISQTYSQVVLGWLGLAAEAFTITAIALLVLVVSPLPALVAFSYFALSAYAMNRLVRHRVSRAGEDVLEHSTRAFQVVFSTLHGAKEIKVRNNAETFVQHYRIAQRDQAFAARRFSFLGELPKHVLELLFVGGVALMTVLSLAQSDPDTALTQLVLFAAAGTRILPSTIRLLANLTSVRFGLPGMRLVVDDLHDFHAREAELAVAAPAGPARQGEIRVDHVSYRYDADAALVVDDISLTIPQGTSLAVVGSSGAGKTTLIDLVLGLLEPTSGRISVGGDDIRDDLPSWQRGIGLVPQHPYLFDDTLAANVAFGGPLDEESRRRVRLSVEKAALDDVLALLPGGLDAQLGEAGSRLSGGQAQRIGIARALFADPSVVILDEATSALDTVTERRVSDSVTALHGSVTVIIVAHRLSTVRHCDQLVFLENGRVGGIGTFDEVRASNAAFARMVELGSIDPPGVTQPAAD